MYGEIGVPRGQELTTQLLRGAQDILQKAASADGPARLTQEKWLAGDTGVYSCDGYSCVQATVNYGPTAITHQIYGVEWPLDHEPPVGARLGVSRIIKDGETVRNRSVLEREAVKTPRTEYLVLDKKTVSGERKVFEQDEREFLLGSALEQCGWILDNHVEVPSPAVHPARAESVGRAAVRRFKVAGLLRRVFAHR